MKKLIAVLLATSITTMATSQAFAQGTGTSAAAYNTRVGAVKRSSGFVLMPAITVGATQFTTLSDFKNQATAGTGTSFGAGLLAEFGRGTFVFQSGLTYMQQKSSANVDETVVAGSQMWLTRFKYEAQFSYIGIPLAIKARTRIGEGVRLAGRLGVTPAFLVGFKEESNGSVTQNGFTTEKIAQTNNDKSGVRNFNLFAIAGFGPEFAVARNQNMRVELGYERSLMSLAKEDSKIGLQSLNLMLSYASAF